MSEAKASRPVNDRAQNDFVLPFAVEALYARGRIVRLGPALDQILHRHAYPVPVARLLGEAVALTALLGASLKLDGRFQLQTRSDGPVDMLVVDFDTPDCLRAFARFDAERVANANPAALLGKGHLALTIDPGAGAARYQGLVELKGQSLEAAADCYFADSEQIPTLVRLAVAEQITPHGRHWRAGGLIVQYLPHSEDRQKYETEKGDPQESWAEARALAATIGDDELIDPDLSSERVLFRLYHERGVKVFEPQALRDQCRCSDQGVRQMLARFSAPEREEMVGDDGRIGVTCEFCSTHRSFDPGEFTQDQDDVK